MKRAAPVLALVLFASFALVFFSGSCPLPSFRSQIPMGLADELLGAWIYDRMGENLTSLRLPIFDGKIFYPTGDTLAFSESMPLVALTYRFFLFFVKEKLLSYHLTNFLFLCSNALVFYFVAKRFLSVLPSLTGAFVFAFSSVRLAQLNHVQLFPQAFFPLAAYSLYRFHQSRKSKYAFLAGVCIGLQFLCSIHFGVMLLVGLFPYAFLQLILKRRRESLRSFAVGMVPILILAGPLLFKYRSVSQEHGVVRTLGDAKAFSASPLDYLQVAPNHPYFSFTSTFISNQNPHEKYLFVGFVVVILAALGMWAGPRGFWWRLGTGEILFAVWLSFGPVAGLYQLLYYLFPLMQALRTPSRFIFLLLFVLAVFASWGMAWILKQVTSRQLKAAIVAGLLAGFIIENYRKITWYSLPTELEGLTRYLAKENGKKPVVHLPLREHYQHSYAHDGISIPNREVVRMYYSLYHEHPLFNGYGGIEPKIYQQAAQVEASGNLSELLSFLGKNGIQYVAFDKNIIPKRKEPWSIVSRSLPILYEDGFVTLTRLP